MTLFAQVDVVQADVQALKSYISNMPQTSKIPIFFLLEISLMNFTCFVTLLFLFIISAYLFPNIVTQDSGIYILLGMCAGQITSLELRCQQSQLAADITQIGWPPQTAIYPSLSSSHSHSLSVSFLRLSLL